MTLINPRLLRLMREEREEWGVNRGSPLSLPYIYMFAGLNGRSKLLRRVMRLVGSEFGVY